MSDKDFRQDVQDAMLHGPVIEQAKGVLTALFGMDPELSFAALRRLSQEHNLKVRDLAEALVGVAAGRPGSDDEARRVVLEHFGRRQVVELARPDHVGHSTADAR